MTEKRLIDVPGMGKLSVQPITVGALIHIEDELEEANENEKALRFAELALAWMLRDPEYSSEDIDALSDVALTNLCTVAAEYLGASEEFLQLKSPESPVETLYAAYRKSWESHVESINDSVSTAIRDFLGPVQSRLAELMKDSSALATANMVAEALRPYEETVGNMAALSLRLSGAERFANLMEESIDPIRLSYARLGIDSSLAEMVQKIASSMPPEPLLSHALVSSGLKSDILHSPTYPEVSVSAPAEIEDWEKEGEEEEQRRRVDAFDVLSTLEVSLRELIRVAMEDEYGPAWWRRKVPEDIRKECAERKDRREEPHRPSLHPIFYAHVADYEKIISRSDNWRNVFQTVFGNRKELQVCFKWVVQVRDPVAHSRPVEDSDYVMFNAGCRWLRERIDRVSASRDLASI